MHKPKEAKTEAILDYHDTKSLINQTQKGCINTLTVRI